MMKRPRDFYNPRGWPTSLLRIDDSSASSHRHYATVRRLRAIRLWKRVREGYMGCISPLFLLFGPLSPLHSPAQLSSESTRNRQGAASGICMRQRHWM